MMVGDRYLEKLKKEHLNDSKYFVSFNPLSPLSERRLPLRHTFILQGSDSLISGAENPRVFKEQFDAFVFQNTRYERGLQTAVLQDSHYLAIPYPRYFGDSRISANGLLLQQDESGFNITEEDKKKAVPKHEFLQQMPSLTRLMLDGSYVGEVERMHKALKHVKLAVRANLLKENDHMEEDEWREKVNQLQVLCEAYRSMALSEEPSDGDESGDDDY